MRLRALTFVLATVALVASACITEQRPILIILLDPDPPDTVEQDGVDLTGRVGRVPEDPGLAFTVTSITTSPGRADTIVVQTGVLASFTVRIRIARDTLGVTNDVVMFATDEAEEDVISQKRVFQILGYDRPPILRGDDLRVGNR